jgi:hypothetical protein
MPREYRIVIEAGDKADAETLLVHVRKLLSTLEKKSDSKLEAHIERTAVDQSQLGDGLPRRKNLIMEEAFITMDEIADKIRNIQLDLRAVPGTLTLGDSLSRALITELFKSRTDLDFLKADLRRVFDEMVQANHTAKHIRESTLKRLDEVRDQVNRL